MGVMYLRREDIMVSEDDNREYREENDPFVVSVVSTLFGASFGGHARDRLGREREYVSISREGNSVQDAIANLIKALEAQGYTMED